VESTPQAASGEAMTRRKGEVLVLLVPVMGES
jgi:hypothetical protein